MKTKDYILLVLAGLSVFTYKKFNKFIKELKLGITVLKLDKEGKNANVLIDNLSHKNIPFHFAVEGIELITDTKKLASNTDKKTDAFMVQNSEKPINFNLHEDTSINEIENSKIAVSFNVLGFRKKVLYQPKAIENQATQQKTAIDCCCH